MQLRRAALSLVVASACLWPVPGLLSFAKAQECIGENCAPLPADASDCTGQNCPLPQQGSPVEQCTGENCDQAPENPVQDCTGENCTPAPLN